MAPPIFSQASFDLSSLQPLAAHHLTPSACLCLCHVQFVSARSCPPPSVCSLSGPALFSTVGNVHFDKENGRLSECMTLRTLLCFNASFHICCTLSACLFQPVLASALHRFCSRSCQSPPALCLWFHILIQVTTRRSICRLVAPSPTVLHLQMSQQEPDSSGLCLFWSLCLCLSMSMSLSRAKEEFW